MQRREIPGRAGVSCRRKNAVVPRAGPRDLIFHHLDSLTVAPIHMGDAIHTIVYNIDNLVRACNYEQDAVFS